MILEFSDGIKINVLNIFGAPQLISGVMRDTLTIEISPETIGFNDLKQLFKNNPATSILYSYTDDGEKNEIGRGYNIFVSVTDEDRKIQQQPGYFGPDEFEEVFIVKIAQMTYSEYQVQQMNNSPSD